jgi:hypothetical protein
MIQQLAGKALQVKQVDDVLFVHAGRVMVESAGVNDGRECPPPTRRRASFIHRH